jgi:hypothetical protein
MQSFFLFSPTKFSTNKIFPTSAKKRKKKKLTHTQKKETTLLKTKKQGEQTS